MKVKDKNVGKMVEVREKGCPSRSCYWPRPDPGVFTQGVGYRARPGSNNRWLCGTREIKGCPAEYCGTKKIDERIETDTAMAKEQGDGN